MAIVSGLVCILAGVARLGFVTELLSKPIRYGYMNGIALTVLLSQTPKLLGFSIEGGGPIRDLLSIGEGIFAGRINWATFAIGGGALAVILLLKGNKRVPGILVAVVAATLVTGLLQLAERAGVSVLGPVPQGLPALEIPLIGCLRYHPGADWRVRRGDGLICRYERIVTGLCRPDGPSCGSQSGNGGSRRRQSCGGIVPRVSDQQQFLAYPVAEAAGAKTQLTGIVGAITVALLLLLAPNLLQNLPNAALAAVVIASAIGLFEFSDLKRIYRIQQWEFWLSILCFVGVAVFGAIPGIGIAVVMAIIEFLWDGWRPHSAVLGRASGVEGYHDIRRYPNARLIPGLVLFRWDAPLFFANAELFKERIFEAVAASPTRVNWVVVAAEPVTSVDVTASDSLAELIGDLQAKGITFRFAELKDPVKDKLKRFGLFTELGKALFTRPSVPRYATMSTLMTSTGKTTTVREAVGATLG